MRHAPVWSPPPSYLRMRSALVSVAVPLALFAGCLHTTSAKITPLNPINLKFGFSSRSAVAKRQSTDFPEYTFTQPLDHFADTGFTFEQHYWLSDRHYQPGGPVIVFETLIFSLALFKGYESFSKQSEWSSASMFHILIRDSILYFFV